MNTPCAWADRDEDAIQFVIGALPANQREAFELHLLACSACRAAVREAATVRAAHRQRVLRWRLLTAMGPAAAVAAAAVAILIFTPSPVERLGAVTPPAVRPMQVRSNADSATAARRGLTAYQRGDFRAAAAAFGEAAAGTEEPGVNFLLGTSLLLAGAADSAVVVLGQVAQQPPSPYTLEARYYRSKAWLQLGRADSAAAELRRIGAAARPELRSRARALLDSLQRVQ